MNNPAFVVELEVANGSPKKPETVHTFEEAVELAGVGKFHYGLLLVCGLCFMAVMVEIMIVGIIMPSLNCDIESTLSQQGFLASAGFLGIVLSSHAMGFLADTWGRVRTMRCALVLSFLATIVSAFSVNIWMLIVFRFLNGFFISGGQACVFSLCGEFHGNRTRVQHVTLLSVFLPLALVYLPSTAVAILPLRIEAEVFGMVFSSWRVLLLVNSSLSLLAVAGLLTLPETPKYELVQGHPEAALATLRLMFARNTGRPADEYPVRRIELQTAGASLSDIHGVRDAVRMIWSQTAPLFSRERWLHTINICLILFVVYGISQGTFMWFPTILNDMVAKKGRDLQVCEIIGAVDTTNTETSAVCNGELDVFMFQVLMMIGGAFTLFYLIFAYTIDIVGKKNLLVGWLLLAAACSAALHYTSDFALAVVLLTLTMGVGNCGGIVGTIAMEFFPTNINAMGMCFIMMIGRLGVVAGGNVIGQILFSNCDLVFWLYVGIILLLCLTSFFLPERKREKRAKTKVPLK